METIGIDIGGVIIDRQNDGTDTSFFSDNFLNTTAVPGAFEAISQIALKYEGRVWIVSKCGPRIQARSREWLNLHRFWEQTEIGSTQICFCLRRDEKVSICQGLGITTFIDDRPDVLIPMEGIVDRRLLFNPRVEDLHRARGKLSGVLQVRNWDDVLRFI